jgi:hypothetical protein
VSRRAPKRVSIGDEITMDGGGKFNGDLDRLVVCERPEF